jgi:hypothetical protein
MVGLTFVESVTIMDCVIHFDSCVAFVAVFPIGVPLLLTSILAYFAHTNRLRYPTSLLSLGFLYEAFIPQLWMFELADMIHKLLLTSVMVCMGASSIIERMCTAGAHAT